MHVAHNSHVIRTWPHRQHLRNCCLSTLYQVPLPIPSKRGQKWDRRIQQVSSCVYVCIFDNESVVMEFQQVGLSIFQLPLPAKADMKKANRNLRYRPNVLRFPPQTSIKSPPVWWADHWKAQRVLIKKLINGLLLWMKRYVYWPTSSSTGSNFSLWTTEHIQESTAWSCWGTYGASMACCKCFPSYWNLCFIFSPGLLPQPFWTGIHGTGWEWNLEGRHTQLVGTYSTLVLKPQCHTCENVRAGDGQENYFETWAEPYCSC